MVFGQLIITDLNGITNAGKLIKTHVTGSIVHSFATLTYQEQFKITKDNNCTIYINPPAGCVIYNVKAKYNNKLTEFAVHKIEEPVFSGYYDTNSSSDAISLTLGQINMNTIVDIEMTCTFTAILSSEKSFTFNIPTETNLLNSQFSVDISMLMPKKNKPQLRVSEGNIKIVNGHLILCPFQICKQFQMIFDFQYPIESAVFSAEIDDFNYLGLSIHPTTLQTDCNLRQEIYLLIDCSGSMDGCKIVNARNALVNFLNALPSNCYFNILRFGTNFERMFNQSVEKTDENLAQSLKYASTLEADLGGTDIYSPLMSIIEQKPRKGFVRQVFALTDGEVENEAYVLSTCTSNRHIMRIFPFGIGYDVNHAFLKDLAKSTMGKAYFIDKSNTFDGISNTVLSALKSSQTPSVVNSQIHIEGVDSFEVAPHPIPTLFSDCLTHLIVRYEKGIEIYSILISGDAGKSSFEEALQVFNSGKSINYQKLFAYHNIRDMEDRLINVQKSDESEMIRENIIRMSMQCGIVSSFTGMFTVINGVEQKAQNSSQQNQFITNNLSSQQNQFINANQTYQARPNIFDGCQQGMTQRQCWAQNAYEQTYQPLQQTAQNWGFSQQGQSQQYNDCFSYQGQKNKPIQQKSQSFEQFQLNQSQQNINPFLYQEQVLQNQHQQNIDPFYFHEQVSKPKQQVFQNYVDPFGYHKSQNDPKNLDNVFDQIQINDISHQIDEFDNDPFVKELFEKQKQDGSWDDISILSKIIIFNSINPTIKQIFVEFPKIEKELSSLSNECILTLLVIGWLYSQRNIFYASYKSKIQKGINYVRSRTNKQINDDISKNFHITDGVVWKFQTYIFS